jgi:hypothetical protein
MERACTETVSFVQNENVSITITISTITSDNYGDGDNNLIFQFSSLLFMC